MKNDDKTKQRTGVIYIVRNSKNNKIYIGQTVQPIVTRWNQHKRAVKNGSNLQLARAMRKYGVKEFTIEVLETNVPSNELNDLEEKYIAKFNSFHSGYNGAPRGTVGRGKDNPFFGRKIPDYQREKLSALFKGKKNSVETRERKRLAHLGKKRSKENAEAIRQGQKNRVYKDKHIAIAKKNLKTFYGSDVSTFVPWGYIAPDGKKMLIHDMTKKEFAKQIGGNVMSIRRSIRSGKPVSRGNMKGYIFFNLQDND